MRMLGCKPHSFVLAELLYQSGVHSVCGGSARSDELCEIHLSAHAQL